MCQDAGLCAPVVDKASRVGAAAGSGAPEFDAQAAGRAGAELGVVQRDGHVGAGGPGQLHGVGEVLVVAAGALRVLPILLPIEGRLLQKQALPLQIAILQAVESVNWAELKGHLVKFLA